MARHDAQPRQSSPWKLFKSLVRVPEALCFSGPCIFFFLTETLSVRTEGLVAVNCFSTSVETRFEHFMYLSSINLACDATKSRRKKRFRVNGGGFVPLLVLSPNSLCQRKAHRIGWIVQRTVKTWDQLATAVRSSVRRSWKSRLPFCGRRRFALKFSITRLKTLVSCDEGAFYTLEASATRNRKKPCKLLQNISYNVTAILRALLRYILKNACSAALSSECTLLVYSFEGSTPFSFNFCCRKTAVENERV